MNSNKIAIVLMAASLIILSITVNRWSEQIGVRSGIALGVIFALEAVLFLCIVMAIRHKNI